MSGDGGSALLSRLNQLLAMSYSDADDIVAGLMCCVGSCSYKAKHCKHQPRTYLDQDNCGHQTAAPATKYKAASWLTGRDQVAPNISPGDQI